MILPWTHRFLMLMTTWEMNWSVVLLAVASIHQGLDSWDQNDSILNLNDCACIKKTIF
jgi:hypothetical protein